MLYYDVASRRRWVYVYLCAAHRRHHVGRWSATTSVKYFDMYICRMLKARCDTRERDISASNFHVVPNKEQRFKNAVKFGSMRFVRYETRESKSRSSKS